VGSLIVLFGRLERERYLELGQLGARRGLKPAAGRC
jgi:hypothetical protein